VQPRADGAYGCAHRARNLLNREVAVEAKDDGDALVGVEVAERALQSVTLVDLAMGVMRGSNRSRSIQIVMLSTSAPAEAIAADVDQDPPEPGVEPIGVTEPGVLAPGSDERVVGRILCLLYVAEDQPREPVGRVQALRDKRLEGGGTSRLRVRRDGPGFLAQTGLSLSVSPLLIPTLQGWETFIPRVISRQPRDRYRLAAAATITP
jgi:hypothetical protein